MSVTAVIRFDVRPDQLDRFAELLNGVLDAMREEESFRNAILHRDPANPCHFMLYETWADLDEVVNVQLNRPYRQAWHEALPELLAQPRDISIWEPLRADMARPEA